MTQATDTDIREIRTAIEVNSRAIDSIAKATEVNAKAIADLTQEMRDGFSSIRTDIKTLDTRTTDLREEMRSGFADIREEMRVGFADIRGEIKDVRGVINTSEAKLVGKVDKLDERTRLGFWGFVGRGLVLAILIALIPFVTRYAGLFLPEILKP